MVQAGPDASLSRLGPRPEVSVVIVHFNTLELLRKSVAALPSAAAGTRYETIVVDNGSVADERPRAESRRDYRVVHEGRNLGFAAAANHGAALARGRYILLLNADAEAEPGSIRLLVAALAGDPSLAAAAPLLRDRWGRLRFPGMRFLNPVNHAAGLLGIGRGRLLGRRSPARGHGVVSVDWSPACALLLRRDAFQAVAGFDEGFFLYEEDEDLAWRLRRAGWGVAVACAARCAHVGGASSGGDSTWPQQQLYRSHLRFLARRCGVPATFAYRFAVTLALLAKSIGLTIVATVGRRRRTPPPTGMTGILRILWTQPSVLPTSET